MAVATKSGKAPLAGQPGYDPFKGDSDSGPKDMSVVETERAVAPVTRRAKREVTAASVTSAKVAPASELLDWLVTTGANRDKLAGARRWVLDNQDATAEQCFRYLEDAESFGDMAISPGTVRRAGKWLWGDMWEPADAATHMPDEERGKLREQVVGLQNDIAMKNSELVSLGQQLHFAKEQLKDRTLENEMLRKRVAPADLKADLGPGRNVLEGADATV